MAELRREVGFYLSFMDEEVFQGVDLPEEEGSKLLAPATATADAPGTTAIPEVSSILKAAPKYAGWDTVVHPCRPVVAAGEKSPSQLLQSGQREGPFNSPRPLPLVHHPNSQRLHPQQNLLHQPEHWH